jgi:diketogulonate reductase-like aldo/keto reductase
VLVAIAGQRNRAGHRALTDAGPGELEIDPLHDACIGTILEERFRRRCRELHRTARCAARAVEGAARRVRPDRPGVHTVWAPGRRRAAAPEARTLRGMTTTRTVELAGGVSMPLLGLGTWQASGREAYDAVRAALDVGYRHVDTATMYGNEDQVGRALADSGVPRSEVFVTTKLPPGRADAPRPTLAASLDALGLDYVDLWLIHWPPPGGARPDVWAQLLDAQADGLARAVGVSNYSLEQIDELEAATSRLPAVNQIEWSPALYDAEVLRGHRERRVQLEGYSPLKTMRLRDPRLVRIADAHGVTPAQVVIRWHIEHEVVVIPKSSKRERIASNADVFGFSLSPDEVEELDRFSR